MKLYKGQLVRGRFTVTECGVETFLIPLLPPPILLPSDVLLEYRGTKYSPHTTTPDDHIP